MCDNNDDEFPKLIKRLNISNEQCKKCQGENGKPVFLLRNDDKPTCKNCFLQSCVHKFRSEFGKTQIVRQGEKLLIGFSGSPSSTAMLLLIKQGLSEKEFRKLRFSPIFVHINENEEIQPEIIKILTDSGFPFHIINPSQMHDDRLTIINENLKNPKFATANKTTKNILLKSILCDLAVEFGCSRVMIANNCTMQAMRILSNIAQGSASYDDTAFHDTRHSLSILQPMRQFSVKEIIFFNKFQGISTSFYENEETFTEKTFSVDRLTEGFIASLTSDFPSTIFTISRTAEKMTSIASEKEKRKCRFCGNHYRSQSEMLGEPTAANSMAFSQSLMQSIKGKKIEIVNGSANRDNLCFTCQSIQDEIIVPLIQ